jgi:glutathione peroxidase
VAAVGCQQKEKGWMMKKQMLAILGVLVTAATAYSQPKKNLETTVVKKHKNEDVISAPVSSDQSSKQTTSAFYDFVVKNSKNEDVKLSDYKGKAVLIVNVASKCGYTNQYEGLQKLYADYSAKGFVVLGFPSNQFFGQEPGTNEEIQNFCKLNYNVNFPVFAKVDVNGNDAIPLYKWLTKHEKFSGRITWNFNKFLINQKGELVQRFGSKQTPAEIEPEIKKLLQ